MIEKSFRIATADPGACALATFAKLQSHTLSLNTSSHTDALAQFNKYAR